MRSSIGFLMVMSLLLAPTIGLAKTSEAGDGTKFGYVDLQRCLNSVGEGKRAKAELQRAFDQKQAAIKQEEKSLETMKNQLEKDRMILSAEAYAKKEAAFRQKFLEVTQKMNNYKMELAQKEAETTGSILNALANLVGKIGQREGYTMILETSQDVVLYAPGNADLTAQVIKEYNQLPQSQRRAKR